MIAKNQFENLCMLIALQMAGFVVVEVIVWILLAVGIMPPVLTLSQQGNTLIQINSGYLVVAGLMSMLVAGFWLAILSEVFGIVEIKGTKLKM